MLLAEDRDEILRVADLFAETLRSADGTFRTTRDVAEPAENIFESCSMYIAEEIVGVVKYSE